MTNDSNLEVFNRPGVVDYYDVQRSLQESERLLFESYLAEGMAILDIGVGAGRTTPFLSKIAKTYIGIDYSDAMIARCRQKFPSLSFLRMDASNMRVFPDGSFDAVVFSFNGIDYLPTSDARRSCLEECSRVLRAGGVLILSSHNARYIFFAPSLEAVGAAKKAWRLIYSAVETVRNSAFRITSKAFWLGAGYTWDPLACGGLTTYVSTREGFAAELREAGFTVLRIVEGQYPRILPSVAVPWYYYACLKDQPEIF